MNLSLNRFSWYLNSNSLQMSTLEAQWCPNQRWGVSNSAKIWYSVTIFTTFALQLDQVQSLHISPEINLKGTFWMHLGFTFDSLLYGTKASKKAIKRNQKVPSKVPKSNKVPKYQKAYIPKYPIYLHSTWGFPVFHSALTSTSPELSWMATF